MPDAPRHRQGYGWLRQLPDRRDFRLSLALPPTLGSIPDPLDLVTPSWPPVWDQLATSSCTAHGTNAAYKVDADRQGLGVPDPSRLFTYYGARYFSGDDSYDGGAQIRDAVRSLAAFGAPAETLWPFEVDQVTTRPPETVYAAGAQHRAIRYEAVPQSDAAITACLLAGYPVVFGMTVTASFESAEVARSGDYNPQPGEQPVGGHCMTICRRFGLERRYGVRNSWGPGWGNRGYGTIPFAQILDPNVASDFWVLYTVS